MPTLANGLLRTQGKNQLLAQPPGLDDHVKTRQTFPPSDSAGRVSKTPSRCRLALSKPPSKRDGQSESFCSAVYNLLPSQREQRAELDTGEAGSQLRAVFADRSRSGCSTSA
jgi:hypothetical protein